MNFLKKTANKISSGIELETLKFERGNLKNQIRHLEEKINTYHQTIELKTHLQTLFEALNATVHTPVIIAGATTTVSNKKTQDNDSDDGVDDEEDPDSFENIQKKTYNTVKTAHENVREIVEKLNHINAVGIDKYNADIDKKKHRIEEINKKLAVLRGKK